MLDAVRRRSEGSHSGGTLRTGETELEMEVRHIAEQEERIARQEVLIERLRKIGVPLDTALGLLGDMHSLLEMMRVHVKRLSN
jgi:hypothetical protein